MVVRTPVFARPGESIRFTPSSLGYSIDREPRAGYIDELIMLVWIDGERQFLVQYRGEPLVELLEENQLLEPGREIWAKRVDDDNWKVAWIGDEGQRREACT